MKSALSGVAALLLVVAGLTAAPVTSNAQAPDSGTPAPAPVGAPDLPAADEDAAPDDPSADEVSVRHEREDRETWDGRNHRRDDGGHNIVFVRNKSDNQMRVRGRIRLVDMHGTRAEPVNAAFAYASCTDCQTFAVALEIALVSSRATTIAPQNRARALNYECTRCVTIARALQYVYVVEDPDQVPDNVNRLIWQMERERLREIARERDISAAEADTRINAVIAEFQELAVSLQDQREVTVESSTPGAPAPAASPMPSPSAN